MKKRKGGFTLVELLIVIMIIAILAGMMLLATGSATDSAEATRVINDLRGLKGAALLYYGDFMVWPSGNLVLALAPYFDRPFDTVRYTDLREYTINPTFIGFTLHSSAVTKQGVRNKLVAREVEAGLFDENGRPYTGGLHIFMHMH